MINYEVNLIVRLLPQIPFNLAPLITTPLLLALTLLIMRIRKNTKIVLILPVANLFSIIYNLTLWK